MIVCQTPASAAGIMDNGSGDTFFAYFNSHGCFLKGFAHESVMSPYQHSPPKLWPGLLDSVPSVFEAALNEPAFMMSDVTFAIWREFNDTQWHTGKIDFPASEFSDGSLEMLSILDADPQSYVNWAADYYESEFDTNAVKHVYEHRPLSNEFLTTFNPDATIGKLQSSLARIGYPSLNAG